MSVHFSKTFNVIKREVVTRFEDEATNKAISLCADILSELEQNAIAYPHKTEHSTGKYSQSFRLAVGDSVDIIESELSSFIDFNTIKRSRYFRFYNIASKGDFVYSNMVDKYGWKSKPPWAILDKTFSELLFSDKYSSILSHEVPSDFD